MCYTKCVAQETENVVEERAQVIFPPDENLRRQVCQLL